MEEEFLLNKGCQNLRIALTGRCNEKLIFHSTELEKRYFGIFLYFVAFFNFYLVKITYLKYENIRNDGYKITLESNTLNSFQITLLYNNENCEFSNSLFFPTPRTLLNMSILLFLLKTYLIFFLQ